MGPTAYDKANDCGEDSGPSCGEAPSPNFISNRELQKTISVQRRRELMEMSARASDWIMEHGIKPHELCFFSEAVRMLTDTRRG